VLVRVEVAVVCVECVLGEQEALLVGQQLAVVQQVPLELLVVQLPGDALPVTKATGYNNARKVKVNANVNEESLKSMSMII
jgi:hypothetical protein